MTLASETLPAFDRDAADSFAERIGDTIDAGALAVMLSIGHRTGLFNTMADLPPATSQQVADAAGLSERYVREWLAAMVVGGVMIHDPETGTCVLPAEHAACLTRGSESGNLAVYAQFVPMAGAAQERVLECFETGAGLSYDAWPCFHGIMAEDSAQSVVGPLFDLILPLVDGLSERLEAGIDVLDAGCGSGRALVALAARYPASRFTGYDLCPDAIASARRNAAAAGVTDLRFEARDLTGFDEPEHYDLVTSFDAIHDQKHPQALLTGICRALRPGGVHLMQDIGGSAHLGNNIDFPFATLLYAMSCVHCMPVSLGQGGDGLGTMWGWETARDMLLGAGFPEPRRHVLPHDPMNVWFVSRK